MNNSKNFLGITIDKHVSIGHIFTTFAAIIAGVSAYAGMINRIQNLEYADARFQAQDERIMLEIEKNRKERQESLEKIDIKLDKIYDKLDKKADR